MIKNHDINAITALKSLKFEDLGLEEPSEDILNGMKSKMTSIVKKEENLNDQYKLKCREGHVLTTCYSRREISNPGYWGGASCDLCRCSINLD